jgi:hypothetical protein
MRAIYEAAETAYVEVDDEMSPISPGNEVRGGIGNDLRDAIGISIHALDDMPQDHADSDA